MKWLALVFVWLVCGTFAVVALHEKSNGVGWYIIGAAAIALVATWTIAEADS